MASLFCEACYDAERGIHAGRQHIEGCPAWSYDITPSEVEFDSSEFEFDSSEFEFDSSEFEFDSSEFDDNDDLLDDDTE
jgi:hypothetical protein